MRNYFTLIAFSLISTFCIGQKLSIKTGDYQFPKDFYLYWCDGDEDKGFAYVGSGKGSVVFQSFDLGLIPKKSFATAFENTSNGTTIGGHLKLKDKTILFSNLRSKDRTAMFSNEVDPFKEILPGKTKKLMDEVFDIFNSSGPKNIVSTDKTKIAFVVSLPKKTVRDEASFLEYKFYVFDDNFNKIWERDFVLPYTEKKAKVVDLKLDNSGNIMLLLKVFNDETTNNFVNDKINYHYEFLKVNKSVKAEKIEFRGLEKNYVEQVFITQNAKSDILIYGYYGAKTLKGGISTDNKDVYGSFIFVLDTNSQKFLPLNKGFFSFPIEVLKEHESPAKQKEIDNNKLNGKENSISFLNLKQLYIDDEGALFFIGEKSYTNFSPSIGETDHNEEVYVQKIGANGTLEWTRKIPKHQVGVKEKMGVLILTSQNGLAILYLDDEKNFNLSNDKKASIHYTEYKGAVYCVYISKDGVLKKEIVRENNKENGYLDFLNNWEIGKGKYLSSVLDGKLIKPAYIQLD